LGPASPGHGFIMRIGNTEVRFLGGGMGCLLMIAASIIASVILTIALNMII
jgi:hypothetical protein